MAALTALSSLILGAGGLVVDTASPDALCPPLAPTQEIVAARLGNVELEGTWRATYVLVHRSEGDFVLLDLRDPSGVVRLERRLPVRGGSCSTLSLMIALILERFFLRPVAESPSEASAADAVDVEPPPVSPSPRPPEPGSTPSAPARSDARASDARSELAPRLRDTTPSNATEWSVDAGLWATTAWLAASTRLSHRIGSIGAGLGVGVDLQDHEEPTAEGSVGTRRIPVTLSGTVWPLRGPLVSSSVGVELIGLFERAWTRDLSDTGSGLRVVPGVGLRAGAEFFGSAEVGPFVEATGAWLLGSASRTFRVDGRTVAAPPRWVFGTVFGLRIPFD